MWAVVITHRDNIMALGTNALAPPVPHVITNTAHTVLPLVVGVAVVLVAVMLIMVQAHYRVLLQQGHKEE